MSARFIELRITDSTDVVLVNVDLISRVTTAAKGSFLSVNGFSLYVANPYDEVKALLMDRTPVGDTRMLRGLREQNQRPKP